MRIKWTRPALDDMGGIQSYIAKDSPVYARQFIGRIFDAAEKLESHPEIGRKVPESGARNNVRELIFQGYRIIYLIQATNIYVVSVIHGARNLSAMNNKPWDVG
jgi:toxin ParE1/3/4